MVIERFSSPEGIPLPDHPNYDVITFLDTLYSQNADQVNPLAPGEYDVTPPVWKNPTYKYNLVVLENGTGALQMIPRHEDSVRVERKLFGEQRTEGGKTVNIPQDRSYIPIVGPKSGDPTLRVYEVLRYQPDEHGDFSPALDIELEDDDELIKTPIRILREAEEKIIDDARKRVLELPWKKYGVQPEDVETFFNMTYGLVLRQSREYIGMSLPLNILDASAPQELQILQRLRNRNKRQLVGNYWLVLLDRISPEQATFVRDLLWTKAPDAIAAATRIDHESFAEDILPTLQKPLLRLLQNLS